MSGTALILGSSGRFGRHAAEAFWNAGWRVRLFDRKTENLFDAAAGADVIVNGWNPAYPDWAKEVPLLTRKVIEAAEASGATILQPANIYVYGDGAPAILRHDTPHLARNPLGRIRIEMETLLSASSAQVILLRAGDYIDTEASGNWFDAVVTKGLARGRLTSPGDASVPHAWAWLPDLARAAVALCERRQNLPETADILFPGWTLSVDEMAELADATLGRPVRVKRLNWLPLRLASPVWRMARGILEMRYLWSMPHRIDTEQFDALLPDFRQTHPSAAFPLSGEIEIDPDQPVARGSLDIAA